jgi:uncharacterized membrane-anchored protein
MRRYGRVLAVIAVQLAILVAIPARQVRARLGGTLITLRTAPVDPVDVLAGHYLTLSYEIERDAVAHAEPGVALDSEVWLTVEQGDPAWTLVSMTREKPAPASGRVSLRGRRERWGRVVVEGAGRLYVTEAQGAASDARGRRSGDLVDLRVGEDGTAAVVRLRGPGIDIPAE